MTWIYKNQAVTEDDIACHYGFVYIITNLSDNRKYIGRKYLTKAGYKTVKGKRKKIRISSGWENYWGSNKKLIEDVEKLGENLFTREIIRWCDSKSECSYYETYEIFNRQALLTEEYYNEWVTCKISKRHVLK